TTAQRTATNQRANASVACAAFATRNAHRIFSRASGRSGNISRSSGICCALHSIANNSRRDSLRGANSPKSPKIRPTRSEGRLFLPSFRLTLDKLTEPVIGRGGLPRHRPARFAVKLSWNSAEFNMSTRVARPTWNIHHRYATVAGHRLLYREACVAPQTRRFDGVGNTLQEP
ncbi:MAG: hypothetical protein JWO52_7552, partial [Gammaproteobacteria bacterium]|nr:hypothetical protein [Gammaproteobacteria bacterium]